MLQKLPAPTGKRLAIHVHPRVERAVRGGHPWVYAEGIRRQRDEGGAGDLAVIFDSQNRFLAIGLYDPTSPIRVRVLHAGSPATIDDAWFAARVAEAWRLRVPLLEQGTDGYRVVNGENDGLPGLIVDRYGDSLVIKLYTAAWLPHLGAVLDGLRAVMTPARIVLRMSRNMASAAHREHGLENGRELTGAGVDGPVLFRENGLLFEADLVHGQKTGFFLDQRDNRARVEGLAGGRTVLNVFAYTGGFSIYAARGGAREVTSLDLSAPALAAAERNFAHNAADARVAATGHRTLQGDAFELLRELATEGVRYDVVILDPPAFAKARGEVDRALESYATLVRLGLDVLERGGTLVAASCSSRVTADEFATMVTDTAHAAGRPLHVLERTGHALDHPVTFAEGAYLKCIFART